MQANPGKVGIASGLMLAGFHLAWATLVALGWGQALFDFVFWANMIHFDYTVGPFDLASAGTLVLATFASGYVLGGAFAVIWNWAHRG